MDAWVQECVEKLKAKLIEAAGVYRKDKETLDWHVMQDPKVSNCRLSFLLSCQTD